jgi:hypothetical protein
MKPNDKAYEGVPEYIKYLIHVLRSTVGAALLPDYSEWMKSKDESSKTFGIIISWVIWFVMLYLNQLIIKNFLINLVRHIYVNHEKN